MDPLLAYVIFVLIFIGLSIGLGLLFYFIPKKLGYPKAAKYLTISFGIFVLAIVFSQVFRDELFTKKEAKDLVKEQDLILTDNFDLMINKSASYIDDYYHRFTLIISESDKQDAISKIKNADNFKSDSGSPQSQLYREQDKYFGKKVIQNYEMENYFVREYLEPSGQEGYAATYRRISISKRGNELIFEDIDDWQSGQ